MEYTSNSLEETEKAAQIFLSENPDVKLIGLLGDLGSGKTAFTKGLAHFLGVEQNITSPTFVIQKIYKGDGCQLVHIDAYRLSSVADLEGIGFNDFIKEPKNIVVMEWPEQVFSEFPENMRLVKFNYIDEHERKISW